jgi:hypothetical protein
MGKRRSVLHVLTAICLPWYSLQSIGQEGDPTTCPLLAQNLQMMQAARGEQLRLNFTVGVPVRLTGIVGLLANRAGTIDISGVWNPANWQRDGRQGYERNTTKEESARFRSDFMSDEIHLSFNKQRGWWMLHPSFDLGPDGTAGWAIVEAPDAEFPHQIPAGSRWKVITEQGIEERSIRHAAEPTSEFLLSLSALLDKNGDEVLEASEAEFFSFGGVRHASQDEAQDWITQADQNKDGVLTMREVADGHVQLGRHKLTKRWLKNTAVLEAALRLLQRESARVRARIPRSREAAGDEVDTAGNFDTGGNDSQNHSLDDADSTSEETGTEDVGSCPGKEAAGWLPFREDSKCPLAWSSNRVFEWGTAVAQKYMPSRLLTR